MPKPENLFAIRHAQHTSILLYSFLLIFAFPALAIAQQKDKKQQTPAAPPALTRTTTRHETRRLGYGSTITILGAPSGSITVEGWNKSEVDITADIELSADTEEELALLAQVNSFILDEDMVHLRIMSTGTHDKKFMKRSGAKNFPKKLLGMPWKINYKIRVPAMSDLKINGGIGAITLSGVEGAIIIQALESEAELTLTGGVVMATIGRGKVNVNLPARSWRGRGAEIQLATGTLTVQLPAGYSGDINADVLRSGQIENTFTALTPRERTTATPRSIKSRAGAGGAILALTVTDGIINIKSADK